LHPLFFQFNEKSLCSITNLNIMWANLCPYRLEELIAIGVID
jgi:hypothetical protein